MRDDEKMKIDKILHTEDELSKVIKYGGKRDQLKAILLLMFFDSMLDRLAIE